MAHAFKAIPTHIQVLSNFRLESSPGMRYGSLHRRLTRALGRRV